MLIETVEIVKIYKMDGEEVHALRGITLSVERNEYIAIMGPSGSGKSTLMNILGCLDKPTSGIYRFEGEDVGKLNDDGLANIRSRKIGFVFQTFNLFMRANVLSNVELPLVYSGIPSKERRERALKVLEQVGLRERAHHKPNEVSGGEKQRVAIARALVNSPSLILADEPTGNLDSKAGKEIMNLFSELHSRGNTIIVVTHDMGVASNCRRIVAIKDGMIESETFKDNF